MKKVAVVLFNLGGPDKPSSIRPFLFNLFYDKAIIRLPNPFRWLVAKYLSAKRDPVARDIYSLIGGKSPINEGTQAQAIYLEKVLNKKSEPKYKVFICMRYWKPFSIDVVEQIKKTGAEKIILLPLYPQFSTTTTESSFDDFFKSMKRQGVSAQVKPICCYPSNKKFLNAHVKLIKEYYEIAKKKGKVRILFSAHGLPESIIRGGDPYQWQVNQTVTEVVKGLHIRDIDYVICFQSKVGPMQWLKPATKDEIKLAANENLSILAVPIAFVSEHSETLVELDIEYKHIADEHKAPGYTRVPTLRSADGFIAALAEMVVEVEEGGAVNKRGCPQEFCKCINKRDFNG
jgi:protoporphyrin/coproporphyrin ferrochelatase